MTSLTKKDLENPAVYQYLLKLVGEEGIALVITCPNEEHSDEEIAEITQINLNSVRHALYNLYEKRLAEYRRIKNNDTGWLTYLWVLKMENIDTVLESEMSVVSEKLSARLKFDKNNDFYQCPTCGKMLTFNDAMTLNFVCPACGGSMAHFDDELLLSALEKRIGKINKELSKE
ncbi:MAG TPA: transcription factor [Methanocorpusculum sp.]|nr:transcription factor [Methanocorpusculum sp.]